MWGGGNLKKLCPFKKYPLPSPPPCSIHDECSLRIAVNNRYQVLEDGRLAVEEDELEIERDFQVMEKAYTEVAGRVLGRPRKRKKP